MMTTQRSRQFCAGFVFVAMFAVALPVQAYTVSVSPGPTTATAGASTCASFDAPSTAICTITGGEVGPYFSPPENLGIRAMGANPSTGALENSITVDLGGLATYFGFLTHSNDLAGNVIDFFHDSTPLGSLDGTSWASPTDPFVNITAGSGEEFNRVVLRSPMIPGVTNGCCFELDNLATDATPTTPPPPGVPQPGTLALLGLGLAALGWRRRRAS